MKRSYDDPCGLARALDAVGERWALHVVRELLLGPKRFTDLRTGLPGASQNVLAQRLRDLTGAGVVARVRLGPPASTWAYELTPWGHDLEAAVLALSKWGSRGAPPADVELSTDALVLALRTTFSPEAAAGFAATVALRIGGDDFAASVADGRFTVTRAGSAHPDATVEVTGTAPLRAVVFAGVPLDGADLRVSGDRAVAKRFLGLFPRPAPLRGPAHTDTAGTDRIG